MNFTGFSLTSTTSEEKLKVQAKKLGDGVVLTTKDLGTAPRAGFHRIMGHIRESTPVLVMGKHVMRELTEQAQVATEEASDAAETLKRLGDGGLRDVSLARSNMAYALRLLKQQALSGS